MGAQAVAISEPGELEVALAGPASEPVVLAVVAPIAAWTAEAVAAVRAAGRSLVAEVVDARDGGEVRDGREIGLVAALLELGVEPHEIAGVAPARVARVAEVVARWHGGGGGAS